MNDTDLFFAPDLELISESTNNCVFLIVPFPVGDSGQMTHKIGWEWLLLV